MPHETIVHGGLTTHRSEDSSGLTTARQIPNPNLGVEWRRDNPADVPGWAQIRIDLDSEYVQKIDQRIHIGMDRKQINHFIKTLRRARDAAYGADE